MCNFTIRNTAPETEATDADIRCLADGACGATATCRESAVRATGICVSPEHDEAQNTGKHILIPMATKDADTPARAMHYDDDGIPEPVRKPKGDSAAADIEAVRPRPRSDRYIWGIYIMLCLISVVELFSASSREIVNGNVLHPLLRHVGLLSVGFLIMLLLQRMHYNRVYKWTTVIVILAVGAAIYTMFFGNVINGARRSFSLLIVTVQPSEILKMTAALLIARVLAVSQINGGRDISNRGIILVSGTVLFFGMLLINQGLTNTALLMIISLSMMLIGGVSWRKWLIVCGIYAVLGIGYEGIKMFSTSKADEAERIENVAGGIETDRSDVRKSRILNFMRSDKYNEPITSENRQEQYSYIAQANGGIFGVGPGRSREAARLPLAFSDYIYAIIVEDTGLVGGLVVMLLYLFLLLRAGHLATKCTKAYPALLVIGMSVFITCQALVHIGIVVGTLPVSGQPLPLISKGGSSVIITSVALGIMLSVSRHATRRGAREEMRDRISTIDDKALVDNPTVL